MKSKSSKTVDTRKAKSDTRPKRWQPDGWNLPAPFPLSYHPPSGRLYKKIKGSRLYFGYARDWEAAVEAYEAHATGKPLPSKDDRLTVGMACDKYLNVKRGLLELKEPEITARTFSEYYQTCARVVEHFGKHAIVEELTAEDFSRFRSVLAKTRGPVALGNEIQRVKMVFKMAFDSGWISSPIRYGQSFDKPKKKALRKAKAKSGSRMYEADELRAILSALSDNLIVRCMVMVSVNCGFGAQDLASLPLDAVDLEGGWIDFPRPKTSIPRRAKLWDETIELLRQVIASRPQAHSKEDCDLVFLTSRGKPWVRQMKNGDDPAKWSGRIDAYGDAFKKVTDSLNINGHRGPYAVRHSFQTVTEDCGDIVAVKYAMGHADHSMSGAYRERIADSRLKAVAETVHKWLFPDK